MKALILTEGGKEKGFGHISRCLSLVNELLIKKIDIDFIIDSDKFYNNLFPKNCKIIKWSKNIETVNSYIEQADIIIIDSYNIQENFNRLNLNSKIVLLFDDFLKMNIKCDIVINGSYGAEKVKLKKEKNIKYLLGSEFMVLKKEFLEENNFSVRKKINSILITLGGTDIRNLIPDILSELSKLEIKKNIIVSSAYHNLDEITKYNKKNVYIYKDINSEKMKNLMEESDLVICAGGQTLNEIIKVGVPAILINIIDNQDINTGYLIKDNIVLFSGNWDDGQIARKIRNNINKIEDFNLRKNFSEISQKIFDGRGSRRILNECLKLFYMKNLKIKKVEKKDCDNIFNLSNEKEVRDNSFSSEKINYNNHINWFEKKINSKNTLFLKGILNNEFIGQIRYDIEEDTALIGISIVKDFRNKGIGQIFLEKSIIKLKKIIKKTKEIYAYVKVENKGSENLFFKTGFKKTDEIEIGDSKSYKFVLKI